MNIKMSTYFGFDGINPYISLFNVHRIISSNLLNNDISFDKGLNFINDMNIVIAEEERKNAEKVLKMILHN